MQGLNSITRIASELEIAHLKAHLLPACPFSLIRINEDQINTNQSQSKNLVHSPVSIFQKPNPKVNINAPPKAFISVDSCSAAANVVDVSVPDFSLTVILSLSLAPP